MDVVPVAVTGAWQGTTSMPCKADSLNHTHSKADEHPITQVLS
jgi:hypothetical protein